MFNLELKKYLTKVKKINKIEESIAKLTDEELKLKIEEIKSKVQNGESLDNVLEDVFAITRQASNRVLGMRHYDEQLIGGLVLHHGKIAEMKTGEGKTLVATLPICLNALKGEGVHVVTTNEYLAKRDKELNEPLFNFMGMSVGVVLSSMSRDEKREQYAKDITYVTNSELGFDYLKDNMVHNVEDRVLRGLNYAIIDEVDSILIDDARTPLIISTKGDKPSSMFTAVDMFVKNLKEEDYTIDMKIGSVTLNDNGVEKAERIFGMSNYSDVEYADLRHIISQSLKANYYFMKDDKYIVRDGEIVLIDSSTGRISEGRRYSDGLHQAIEAKEGVKIKEDNKTLATITYQNFFTMYNKLGGMSGTAKTEEDEFRYTYNLDVIEIPTHLPVIRIDCPDKIYFSEEHKTKAIIKDIKECYDRGQPVLLGTESISKSEEISSLLNQENIPHVVLNAKNHSEEAEIIALAGQKQAVTISTNMAGRGTDIKLGEGVPELGGLKVIGTYKNDNRRIDNQLRGRSGRQGDPVVYQFYVSIDDELIKTFMHEEKQTKILSKSYGENECLNDKFTTKIIEGCQKKLEGIHFDARKSTKKYDDAINVQRIHVYKERDVLIMNENLLEIIPNTIKDMVPLFIDLRLSEAFNSANIEEFDKKCTEFTREVKKEAGIDIKADMLYSKPTLKNMNAFKEYCTNAFLDEFNKKKEIEGINQTIKSICLKVMDALWIDHLEDVSALRKGMQFAGLKQQDPITEFIIETNKLFEDFVFTLRLDTIFNIMKYKVSEDMIHNSVEPSELQVSIVRRQLIHNDNIIYESGKINESLAI